MARDFVHSTGVNEAILHAGDMLDVLATLPDHSVDAVVSDPPYGIADYPVARIVETLAAWLGGDRSFIPGGKGFMGREWDRFVPPPAAFDEIVRVTRPGAHVVMFAHARTQDLMGLSSRLAGLELRDTLAWVSGQGMPKGANLARFANQLGEQYAGYASQLKPSYEPILLFRTPMEGSLLANVATHGTGALNIDGCRIGWSNDADRAEAESKNQHARFGSAPRANNVMGDASMIERTDYTAGSGRWPANALFDEQAAAELDDQSGITRSRKGKPRSGRRDETDVYGRGRSGFSGVGGPEYDDIGGASRFFYCPKVSTRDRVVTTDGRFHVSVKPVALMDWLVRLVLPPAPSGGRPLVVLDPFAGTSTTLESVVRAGHRAIGVESDPTSIELSRLRFERSGLRLEVK